MTLESLSLLSFPLPWLEHCIRVIVKSDSKWPFQRCFLLGIGVVIWQKLVIEEGDIEVSYA